MYIAVVGFYPFTYLRTEYNVKIGQATRSVHLFSQVNFEVYKVIVSRSANYLPSSCLQFYYCSPQGVVFPLPDLVSLLSVPSFGFLPSDVPSRPLERVCRKALRE